MYDYNTGANTLYYYAIVAHDYVDGCIVWRSRTFATLDECERAMDGHFCPRLERGDSLEICKLVIKPEAPKLIMKPSKAPASKPVIIVEDGPFEEMDDEVLPF